MVRSSGNEQVPGLKRTGGVDSLHRSRSPIPPLADWRSVLNIGPGEDNPRPSPHGTHPEGDAFLLSGEERTGISLAPIRWDDSLGCDPNLCENHMKASVRIQLQPRSLRTRPCILQQYITILHICPWFLMGYKRRGSTPRRDPTKSSHVNLQVPTLPPYPTSPGRGPSPPLEVL